MRLAQYRTRDLWSASPRAVPRASPPLAQLFSDDFGSRLGSTCRRRQREGRSCDRFPHRANRYGDNKGHRLRGTGTRTDPTGGNDSAALRIGAFGESQEIADIKVARRPSHRKRPRTCIGLPDEQQTRRHAGNAATL